MALIKCPDCGKEISTKSSICPNCGKPFPARTKAEWAIFYISITFISIVMLIATIMKLFP